MVSQNELRVVESQGGGVDPSLLDGLLATRFVLIVLGIGFP